MYLYKHIPLNEQVLSTCKILPFLLMEVITDLSPFQRDKVEAFVSKVNGAMRVRHELEKLKTTAERIYNNYNVVEAVNEEMEKVMKNHDNPFSPSTS